eukprot:TCONS_00048611-protein
MMSSEQAQVDIINSSCDEKTLIKTLVIIHRDILQNERSVCFTYVEKKLVEALVARLVSCEKNITLGLSLSLLNQIFMCGIQFKERLLHLEALEECLLDLISPQTHDKSEESKKHMLLIHQSALRLLINMNNNMKYQNQIVGKGLFEKIKDLLVLHSSKSAHKDCCQCDYNFSDDARTFMKQLIESKKLVGKIDPDQSSVLEKGALSILSVDLFDTRSKKDIHINKMFTESGLAWPDIIPSEAESKREDMWCDFNVTKCVDAHCFWAHVDNESHSKIKGMANAIEDHIYSSDVCPLETTEVGQKVFCDVGKFKPGLTWCRGCVLETFQEENFCSILLVDYGFVVQINIDQLFLLPEILGQLPHQAKLCVLKEVKAPPTDSTCLQLTLELLCNLTSKGHGFRIELHRQGFTELLIKLCSIPDKDVVLRSFAVLGNLALNFHIRSQIGYLEGMKLITTTLMRHSDDQSALRILLDALINFLIECSQNRNKIASENILLVLITLYRSPKTNEDNKNLALRALKNLVRDGWRMLDPINNVKDIREITDKGVDGMRGCFELPNLCGDELMEEVKKRRNRKIAKRGLRDHEALPDPTYKAINMDELVNKLGGLGANQDSDTGISEGEHAMNFSSGGEGYLGNESFGDEDDDNFDGYVYRRRLDALEDETHCFMYESSAKNISSINIGNTVCGFLNSSVMGTIYLGISPVGIIVGINICRKERDNLRLGVDELLGKFDPSVKHHIYEISFLPVMKKNESRCYEQFEERYIIEIKVLKNVANTVYQTPARKMFFRKGASNCEYTVQEIRARTIEQQEAKYQAEIRTLQLTLEEARRMAASKN